VKEIISIGERTFGHLARKKKSWRRLNFSIRKRDYFYRRKRLFLFTKEIISIGERDYFYRRKNFGHSAEKKKAGDGSTFLFAKEIIF